MLRGKHLPLFRALDDSLVCCPQARLRTFPDTDCTGHTRGWDLLDRDRPPETPSRGRAAPARCHTRTDATLRERLLDASSAAVAILGQFRGACGNFDAGCRPCLQRCVCKVCYKHPWGAKSHALAIAFLPAFVGDLLGDDGIAHGHDLMDYAAMQALAMGGQPALFGRFASPGLLVALAAFPGSFCLPRFLMRPRSS